MWSGMHRPCRRPSSGKFVTSSARLPPPSVEFDSTPLLVAGHPTANRTASSPACCLVLPRRAMLRSSRLCLPVCLSPCQLALVRIPRALGLVWGIMIILWYLWYALETWRSVDACKSAETRRRPQPPQILILAGLGNGLGRRQAMQRDATRRFGRRASPQNILWEVALLQSKLQTQRRSGASCKPAARAPRYDASFFGFCGRVRAYADAIPPPDRTRTAQRSLCLCATRSTVGVGVVRALTG